MRLLSFQNKNRFLKGLSLVELFLTIGVIAILATITGLAVTHVGESARDRKLESDVSTLNAAIKLYISNGGSLATLTAPDHILKKLKSTRSKADKELHVGAPSGRMIDARVSTIAVADGDDGLRATYNAAEIRFDIASSGAGVRFILDNNLAEVASDVESRSHGAVNYAQSSTWVWDNAGASNPNAPQGPNTFTTNPTVADTTPGTVVTPPSGGGEGEGGGGGSDDPPADPIPPQLPTPIFDKGWGAYPEDDFPLTVTITNVPSSADAEVIYQIGSGTWGVYTAPVSIPMNSSLRAQFIAKVPTAYLDSYQNYTYYYPVPDSLSGTVEANFHSPVGGPNLVYQITNDNDRFVHGDSVYILDGEPINTGDPNVLEFTSQSFSDIPPGTKFKLGDFYYHNGNSYYDSHATGVMLQIIIDLPERGQTLTIDLNLDLINTPNDPDDANASADYVQITNLSQNIPLQINGVNYRIQLEFGATDSFGFSNQSQFHVYEGATGQGELLGTFYPN
ncbi:MAG: choice-of-anchor K domain-containing protein [Verrucomicrobiales bacterium]|nr:choice-of-anchor K domain-containing protein [Verrucomicrobiales bacterium]